MSGMDCEAVRRLLPALIDSELVGEERAAFEAHVEHCPSCRARWRAESRLALSMRTALAPRPASPELRQRVDRLLRAAPRRRPWLAAAATSLLAAGLALMAAWSPLAHARSELVDAAVDAHLRHAAGRLPLEVRSDRADEVTGFFAGRVPFQFTLPDYPVGPGEKKLYTLEGGRLVSLAGDYAAYVAYRMDGRPISLVVAPADRVQPAGRELVRSGGLTFHIADVAGLEVITWLDNGLGYALASDVQGGGARSCLVCHGAAAERSKLRGLQPGI